MVDADGFVQSEVFFHERDGRAEAADWPDCRLVRFVEAEPKASDAPQRKHTLALKLAADTFPGLLRLLEEVQDELTEAGTNGVTVLGGPERGGTWCHVVDEQQTHARYFEQVSEYLAEQKRERGT